MKGQSSLMLVCTELPLTYHVFGTTLDCGCTQPQSLVAWYPWPAKGCHHMWGGSGHHEGGRQCNYRPMKRSTTLYSSSHLILRAPCAHSTGVPVVVPQVQQPGLDQELVRVGMGLIYLALSFAS